MGNLRPAPMFMRPSVVRKLINAADDLQRLAKVIEVPVLETRLVDVPRRSEDPRLAKANDDTFSPLPVEQSGPISEPEEGDASLDRQAQVVMDPDRKASPSTVPQEEPRTPPPADPDLDRPAAPETYPEFDAIETGGCAPPVLVERAARQSLVLASKPARKSDVKYRYKLLADARELEAPVDAALQKKNRRDLIREAAARLAAAPKAEPRLSIGTVTRATMTIPPLPFEQRRRKLEAAVHFLKARMIAVDVIDRQAQVRRYRVSGKRESMLAEDVIEYARGIGFSGETGQ